VRWSRGHWTEMGKSPTGGGGGNGLGEDEEPRIEKENYPFVHVLPKEIKRPAFRGEERKRETRNTG